MKATSSSRYAIARLAAMLVLLLGGFVCVWLSFWTGLVLMLVGVLLLICLWPQASVGVVQVAAATPMTDAVPPQTPPTVEAPLATSLAAAPLTSALTPSLDVQQQRLSFLSHDLRSPVASILALAESMRVKETDDVKLASLGQLVNYAERSLRTSELLVQLLRVELSGALSLAPQDLLSLAEEVRDERVQQARQASLTLEVQLDGGVEPWVDGDGELLQLALDNLVDNALRYSSPGGTVLLRVTVDEAGMAACSVEDQGCGIEAEDQALLFSHYGRLRHSAPELNGSGLGLHLVGTIARCHGGRIEVASELGRGSRFTLCLPLSSPD